MGCAHPQNPQHPVTTNSQGKINSTTNMNPNQQEDKHKPSQSNGQKNRSAQVNAEKKQNKKQKQIYNSQHFEVELDAFIDRIFTTYDTDKSGVLQMNQFSRLLRENIYPDVVSDQEAEKFLKIADLNQNRVVQKSELKTLYKTLIKY